jgi:prepilin-type N-terminal cleavage/methylation domain-containing protein
MNGNMRVRNRQNGFSLLEMMLVLLIFSVVSGGIFLQLNTAQQRAFSEQVKLDNFQEARDFVDQFFRDINQIGYPNSRMVDTTSASSKPSFT